MPRARRVLGFAARPRCCSLACLRMTASAQADEPSIDYADGPRLAARSTRRTMRELAEWSKTQPAVPTSTRGRQRARRAMGRLHCRRSARRAISCSRASSRMSARSSAQTRPPWSSRGRCRSRSGPRTRARVIAARSRCATTGSTARWSSPGSRRASGRGRLHPPGYRFLYHPSDWVVGVGGGLGSTSNRAATASRSGISLGPEAVMQFGHCCDASYFTFAVRYDRYFAGDGPERHRRHAGIHVLLSDLTAGGAAGRRSTIAFPTQER